MAMITCAIEQITNGVLAQGFMRMAIAREQKRAGTRQRP